MATFVIGLFTPAMAIFLDSGLFLKLLGGFKPAGAIFDAQMRA